MKTYRDIEYVVKDTHFVHFRNPRGSYKMNIDGQLNKYGRDTLVRSLPEGCKLTIDQFAKTVIDHLYERMNEYQKTEMRLFNVSKSNKYVKNVLNS